MHPFFRGFFAGLLVGAAVALLRAPATGVEFRQGLRRRFQEALEAGRAAAREQDARLRAHYRRTIGAPREE